MVSRVAAFDWFLCRLLKVFNTHFYYDIREGDGESDRARVARKLVPVAREGRGRGTLRGR